MVRIIGGNKLPTQPSPLSVCPASLALCPACSWTSRRGCMYGKRNCSDRCVCTMYSPALYTLHYQTRTTHRPSEQSLGCCSLLEVIMINEHLIGEVARIKAFLGFFSPFFCGS
ncbi:hypothetical protein BJY00DRAFT_51951 [Aspergillus carlsbadensis]|nr:hypothetical protein BJY00DRAFT_51951 [Aspergillus carlsbadensis]